MKKDFNKLINELKPTIFELGHYVDFDKANENVEKYINELNTLTNIVNNNENKIEALNSNYKNISSIFPALLALRTKYVQTLTKNYDFNDEISIVELQEFLENSGLKNIITNKSVSNFRDYLFGLEVGMDTNARKNRTGKAMEDLCETILRQKVKNLNRQVSAKDIGSKVPNFDWRELTEGFTGIKSNKIFDFLFEYNGKYYVVEVNFFASGGSKLNETVKSFIFLNERIKKYNNIEFIWITDGFGWKKTINQLREAYEEIKYLFNIEDIKNNKIEELLGD